MDSVRWLVLKRLPIAFIGLLVVVGMLLVACGDDDDKDDESSTSGSTPTTGAVETDTPEPSGAAGDQGETPAGSESGTGEESEDDTTQADLAGGDNAIAPEGELSPTPSASPATDVLAGTVFEQAAEIAQKDLAEQLGVERYEIELLAQDTPLMFPEPLVCPPVELEGVVPETLFLQHERTIYPYQYYVPPDAPDTLVVEPCVQTLVDTEELYVPTPEAEVNHMDRVKADLRARGIDPAQGKFAVREMIWNDEALGCPPGFGAEKPARARIEGYLVNFTIDDVTYEYHTDLTGERLELCSGGQEFASAEEFIAALEELDFLQMRRSDEPAQYSGLDQEGILLLLYAEEWGVGVFEFETPNAARIAGEQIDRSHVFAVLVAGHVLLVQEDNSPQVYSLLRGFAEELPKPENLPAVEDFPESE